MHLKTWSDLITPNLLASCGVAENYSTIHKQTSLVSMPRILSPASTASFLASCLLSSLPAFVPQLLVYSVTTRRSNNSAEHVGAIVSCLYLAGACGRCCSSDLVRMHCLLSPAVLQMGSRLIGQSGFVHSAVRDFLQMSCILWMSVLFDNH